MTTDYTAEAAVSEAALPATALPESAVPGEQPVPPNPNAPAADAAPLPPPAVEPPAVAAAIVPAKRRGAVAMVVGRRLARFVFAVALLGGGVVAGYQYYLNTRPVETPQGDPAVVGVPTPPVVAELASAVAADDADRIRVALTPEMFGSYTSEMERFGIVTIDKVATLGTFAEGSGSATELVILGRAADRSPFTINLVVIAQDGQIVKLR
jgi:hypothetical protein